MAGSTKRRAVAAAFLLGWAGLVLAAAGCGAVASERRAPSVTPGPVGETASDWRRELDGYLDLPVFERARWGIQAVEAATGMVLYERDAERLFQPASNVKHFTVAAALDRLGGAFQFSTSLRAMDPPDVDGTVTGDLFMVGGGDPVLGGGSIWAAGSTVEELAERLTAAGVRRVTGDVVGDGRWFEAPAAGGGWTWEDSLYAYGAPVSALTVAGNVMPLEIAPGDAPGDPPIVRTAVPPGGPGVTVRAATVEPSTPFRLFWTRGTGSGEVVLRGRVPADSAPVVLTFPLAEPERVAAERLSAALREAGVDVEGVVRTAEADDGPLPEQILAEVASPPLRELVRAVQKSSQNLHAQLLLLHLGRAARSGGEGTPEIDDQAAGLVAVRQFAGRLGVPDNSLHLQDGAGLGRANLVTPAALVQLLRAMEDHREASAFRDALPVGGRDGTLRRRFAGGPLEGRVVAKTGTLRGVSALSGYLDTAERGPVVFAILLNNYLPAETGSPTAREAVDEVVRRLHHAPGGP
ncbi:MAG: D-alanyl-D-alanine carboxypeptidase/D-alanyl-D-alanine-endopeptidase [Puniceicoccaceae bacterium]|nr:MAG: D-alanyl-D-alanine carboxypeptidase/D-alanyl-D-alanine-endopeptidase [Puniceicoccaceae bacterium]